MSKIIRQQLNLLNKEKEEEKSSLDFEHDGNDTFIERKHRSPLDKIIEKKVDEEDILQSNLDRFRKKLDIKSRSKSAKKKQELIEKTVAFTDDTNKKSAKEKKWLRMTLTLILIFLGVIIITIVLMMQHCNNCPIYIYSNIAVFIGKLYE
ncbi:hypothetical protein PPL_09266 [Heterostelium album PN500]|uniref:Uncharacterized protein n=1 Tax=Heterostelium pallidum (strain ATCC 26659 / Pp 5 / PN500) TaxID=670386 RepID=D3BL34_HETP5|nr:hypothetical protein PPL_09266 [Heterostelium album PN500]EFA77768.1 hypothetical protein PPL_09266 [Heterostelium album PN500]|eukprot:XP_020429896.1 hypothetical protein PPL_09266 [Heterostelium album PN500]